MTSRVRPARKKSQAELARAYERRHQQAFLEQNWEPPPYPSVPGQLDRGIKSAVELLQSKGIETFESCEGSAGHSYKQPTVRFHGTPEAGWRAVGVCLAFGLPILELRRVWDVLERIEPTGPYWEVTFRRRLR